MSKKKIGGSMAVFAGLMGAQALASQTAAAMEKLTPVESLSAEVRAPIIEKITRELIANPELSEDPNLSFFVDSEGRIYALSNTMLATGGSAGQPSCVARTSRFGEPSCVVGGVK